VVPATNYLYGGAAWWLPRWLGKILPDLDIEGHRLTETMDAAAQQVPSAY
jgi:RND superfamily putative drug exporter